MANRTKRKGSKQLRTKTAKETTRQVPLEMVLPPEMPLLYVDNVNILHTENEFTISFLQARPPLFSSQTTLDSVTKIETFCVARIVITPPRFQSMLQTMNGNFKKYVEAYLTQGSNSGNDNTQTDSDTTAKSNLPARR